MIASLSLGTSRRFDLKHLNKKISKSSCELSNARPVGDGQRDAAILETSDTQAARHHNR